MGRRPDHRLLGAAYGEVSPDGIGHFRVVAAKIGETAANEPRLKAAELSAVRARTLIVYAADDLPGSSGTSSRSLSSSTVIPNVSRTVTPPPVSSKTARSV